MLPGAILCCLNYFVLLPMLPVPWLWLYIWTFCCLMSFLLLLGAACCLIVALNTELLRLGFIFIAAGCLLPFPLSVEDYLMLRGAIWCCLCCFMVLPVPSATRCFFYCCRVFAAVSSPCLGDLRLVSAI